MQLQSVVLLIEESIKPFLPILLQLHRFHLLLSHHSVKCLPIDLHDHPTPGHSLFLLLFLSNLTNPRLHVPPQLFLTLIDHLHKVLLQMQDLSLRLLFDLPIQGQSLLDLTQNPIFLLLDRVLLRSVHLHIAQNHCLHVV